MDILIPNFEMPDIANLEISMNILLRLTSKYKNILLDCRADETKTRNDRTIKGN